MKTKTTYEVHIIQYDFDVLDQVFNTLNEAKDYIEIMKLTTNNVYNIEVIDYVS